MPAEKGWSPSGAWGILKEILVGSDLLLRNREVQGFEVLLSFIQFLQSNIGMVPENRKIVALLSFSNKQRTK